MPATRTPVLIAGGSLVGLSTAVFLAAQGVPALLVERHPGTSIYARAWGVNPRTMELYRAVDLEDEIRAEERRAPGGITHRSGILRAESLAGRELGWFDVPYAHGVNETSGAVSPTGWVACPQDRLEPILRRRAEAAGATLRFGVELAGFEQDPDGVTAVLRDRTGDRQETVRTDWLVAADGNGSPARARLGIATSGIGTLVHNVAILFRADLTAVLRGRSFMHCQVLNPQVQGVLGTDGERTQLDVRYRPEAGERPEDFTEPRCVELVRAAVGVADLEVEILATLPWELGARTADRVRAGRAFLAGDAAHVMPPTGGFGANTGVQDAWDLAWKLGHVVRGLAGDALLDTYQAERLPVGRFTVDQAVARSLARFGNPAAAVQATEIVDDLIVMMGYRYRSGAVVTGSGDEDGDGHEDPRYPTGRPGTRAPHLPVAVGGRRRSSLDLVGRDVTLLTGPGGGDWMAAAAAVAVALDVPLATRRFGQDVTDLDGSWPRAYGVEPDGAVLVRPDGFIAWRATGARPDPELVLGQVVRQVLGRTGERVLPAEPQRSSSGG